MLIVRQRGKLTGYTGYSEIEMPNELVIAGQNGMKCSEYIYVYGQQ